MSTEEYLKQFIEDLQYRFSPSTLTNYKRSVNQMFAFTAKPIAGIRKQDLQNWLGHLTEQGYKVATVYLHVCALKSFFSYCVEEEMLIENPAADLAFPRREESIPKYLTAEQLTGLREHVETVRERAIIEILYATGVRISELAAMKKTDINWMERTILIPEGKGKKGRIVLFTPECAEHLQGYLKERTDQLPYVFLNTLETKAINWKHNKFRVYSNELGYRVTHHIMRHTFAAHLAQKGMPLAYIQVLLGHADIQNTKTYTRLYNAARKEMYDKWM